MKIVSLFNNKGGVAKTTTAINVSHILSALHNKKVLLVDCDGQQNLSRFFCDEQINIGIENALFEDQSPEQSLFKTRYENVDILVSTSKMNNASIAFDKLEQSIQRERLESIKNFTSDDYDIMILDLPPALNSITKGFLSISDNVIVPIELGTFAIQGIAKVTETINDVGAKFGGCFVSKFDKNNPSDLTLLGLLKDTLGNKAFNSYINYSRVVKNSVTYKLTAYEYMPWTEPVEQYIELTKEILQRVDK